MQNRSRMLIAAVMAAISAVWLMTPTFAEQSGSSIPDAHKGITKYEGAKTCAGCHPNAAKEVATSLHYQQAAEPQFVEGWEKGKVAGMMVSF